MVVAAQFKESDAQQVTRNKITCSTKFVFGKRMLEAIGTEDINQKYSITLYDFEQKRGVVTIDCEQCPTLLQQYSPEVLLAACEDYTYCYRIK